MKPESNSLNCWVSAKMNWRERYCASSTLSKLFFTLYLIHTATYLWLKLCFDVGSLDFKMSGKEFSGQRPWSWCQRSSREDAAALHRGQQFLRSRKLISKQFWPFLFGQQVLQPTVTLKISVSVSQRTEDAAEARTSGSVSPADFFSQTPKEISNFQIPVSCGKISQFIMC